MKFRTTGLVVLLLLATAPSLLAQGKPKQSLRNFTALDVENFENPRLQTKEAMPEDWIPIIREDIVQRVIEIHRFRRVKDFVDSKVSEKPAERVLILRGKIMEFTRGSMAKRYLVGFGAGKGKIVAMCTFVNKNSGNVVWERKVDGRVIGTFQDTQGAIKGLSKEIAKVIQGSW